MEAYALESSHGVFGESRNRFEGMVSWLDSQEAAELTHGELEAELQLRGRELLRQLTQDHLDRRARRERRLVEVVGADGVGRSSAETGRVRGLSTVFGPVTVRWVTLMRPQALRPATARAAARATPKLATRLSRGEKRHRKRMAEVGSVYDATPVPRTAQDILSGADRPPRKRPTARGKWLVASVTADTDEVIG
ncbi:MAG: hypothetical protein ACT4NY_19320 [Pseudonocardiales bacterium]